MALDSPDFYRCDNHSQPDAEYLSHHTPSSASVRSNFSFCESTDTHNAIGLNVMSRYGPEGMKLDGEEAHTSQFLGELIGQFILKQCSIYEHCSPGDFDKVALNALAKLPFLQALQTVEHYAANISPRVHKKSAYLMGILKAQEAHYERTAYMEHQPWSAVAADGMSTAVDLLSGMSQKLLICAGKCCISGNCLPSDFSPQVCKKLMCFPVDLGVKAISAFNDNKRIIAGVKGGVVNRSRFFLKLIENVVEQNWGQQEPELNFRQSIKQDHLLDVGLIAPMRLNSKPEESMFFQDTGGELNLEEIANLNVTPLTPDCNESPEEMKIQELERELTQKIQNERLLLRELETMQQRLHMAKAECSKLRSVLGIH